MLARFFVLHQIGKIKLKVIEHQLEIIVHQIRGRLQDNRLAAVLDLDPIADGRQRRLACTAPVMGAAASSDRDGLDAGRFDALLGPLEHLRQFVLQRQNIDLSAETQKTDRRRQPVASAMTDGPRTNSRDIRCKVGRPRRRHGIARGSAADPAPADKSWLSDCVRGGATTKLVKGMRKPGS